MIVRRERSVGGDCANRIFVAGRGMCLWNLEGVLVEVPLGNDLTAQIALKWGELSIRIARMRT